MSFINIDIGAALAPLFKWVGERPGRLVGSFFAVLVLAAAAALVFSDARFPFAITALVALFAMVAIGSLAAGQTEASQEAVDASPDIDTVSQDRQDHRHYMNLAHLNGDTHRKWVNGEFVDPERAVALRANVLEAALASEAERLQNIGLKNASILIVRREGDEYIVRRVGGALKTRLSRDDRCPADCDLKQALLRYAPHSHYNWISCCGRQLAVVAIADAPFGTFAEGEVARIALFYQTEYERLHLLERTAALQVEPLPASSETLPASS